MVNVLSALDSLGFGNYKEDAMSVMQEAKAVAAKKRRGSSRLENLGIPEEELLRQQQELFAKVCICYNYIPFSTQINKFSSLPLLGINIRITYSWVCTMKGTYKW